MIYIVEDDAAIRELEQYALQSSGYEVTSFESSELFWQAMHAAEPELVILDVMLLMMIVIIGFLLMAVGNPEGFSEVNVFNNTQPSSLPSGFGKELVAQISNTLGVASRKGHISRWKIRICRNFTGTSDLKLN